MSNDIQPMGRLETNQWFNNTQLEVGERPQTDSEMVQLKKVPLQRSGILENVFVLFIMN